MNLPRRFGTRLGLRGEEGGKVRLFERPARRKIEACLIWLWQGEKAAVVE